MNRREPRETESVSSDEADETRTKTGGLHTQSEVLDTHPDTGMVGEDPNRRKKLFTSACRGSSAKKTTKFFYPEKVRIWSED
jgi:hypothetical protein